ncbi:MAG: PA2928 family protein [Verrucomicrobiota bacterium]
MKKFLIFLGLLGLVGLWKLGLMESKLFLSPPEILGGPVYQSDEHGDRLYFLTSQWEKRISRIGGTRYSSSRKTTSWLHVDLWALDAATAQPVFRKRLKKDKVNGDLAAMGVEQGILWARIPELAGIRLSDGAIVADRAKIEARNASLSGLMPKPPQLGIFLTESMQPLKFDPAAGMIVRLDDARRVRIDPLTLEATPYVADPEGKKPATADRKAVERISNGMDWYAMVRGVAMERPDDDMDWLGLMAESELAQAKTVKAVSNQMDFTEPRRHRLYRARLDAFKTDFGISHRFVDPVALAESPEFLMAGLLAADVGSYEKQTALWRRDPDSVFVLSRDRLGEDGRLQLARISGPAGKPVWSTALPLSNMSAWLPGEDHALMLGPDPSAPRSPMAEEGENPVMQIVSIHLKTGALNPFNLDLHRDWPAEDLTQSKP